MALQFDSPWTDVPPPVPVRRFTVDEYHRLAEIGVLTEKDRVELLEGWIVPKMIRSPGHDGVLHQVSDLLRTMLPADRCIRIQSAITTADSEPEPDMAVVVGPQNRYRTRHPRADEVAIVIEIASSSLKHDSTVKSRVYARAGIACYWVIDITTLQIHVYSNPCSDPNSGEYTHCQTFTMADRVPVVIDGTACGALSVAEALQ